MAETNHLASVVEGPQMQFFVPEPAAGGPCRVDHDLCDDLLSTHKQGEHAKVVIVIWPAILKNTVSLRFRRVVEAMARRSSGHCCPAILPSAHRRQVFRGSQEY